MNMIFEKMNISKLDVFYLIPFERIFLKFLKCIEILLRQKEKDEACEIPNWPHKKYY